MMDSQHLHLIPSDPVDEAVAPQKDLSNIGHAEFGEDSPRPGMVAESLGGLKGSIGENSGVGRCISRDEEADRLEIIERLRGPRHLSHRAIRAFASSCVINSPRSAC